MFQITGSYGTADVISDAITKTTRSKLMNICNDRISINSEINLMPNGYHINGILNGLVMTIASDRLSPLIVNPDIGCGILCCKIRTKGLPNLDRLDYVIRHTIPSGNRIRKVRAEKIPFERTFKSRKLVCSNVVDMSQCINSIGTLGAGEHYIQLAEASDGYYLIIHSGSRLYGRYMHQYYSALYTGKNELIDMGSGDKQQSSAKFKVVDFARDATTLYHIAYSNRAAICYIIALNMGWNYEIIADKTHDYIMGVLSGGYIMRNSVQAAHPGTKVIVPSNTVDGIILGTAKDNSENYMNSAPGSAGRIHSKADMKKYTLSDYQRAMKGIYCTTISQKNIYTAPMAYNSLDYITNAMSWIKVDKILKPIYMFKPII